MPCWRSGLATRGAGPYLERLEAMGRRSADEKLAWWEEGVGRRTTFYGAGPSGNIETTALATLAMIEGRASPATIRAALAWLVQQKDASARLAFDPGNRSGPEGPHGRDGPALGRGPSRGRSTSRWTDRPCRRSSFPPTKAR